MSDYVRPFDGLIDEFATAEGDFATDVKEIIVVPDPEATTRLDFYNGLDDRNHVRLGSAILLSRTFTKRTRYTFYVHDSTGNCAWIARFKLLGGRAGSRLPSSLRSAMCESCGHDKAGSNALARWLWIIFEYAKSSQFVEDVCGAMCQFTDPGYAARLLEEPFVLSIQAIERCKELSQPIKDSETSGATASDYTRPEAPEQGTDSAKFQQQRRDAAKIHLSSGIAFYIATGIPEAKMNPNKRPTFDDDIEILKTKKILQEQVPVMRGNKKNRRFTISEQAIDKEMLDRFREKGHLLL